MAETTVARIIREGVDKECRNTEGFAQVLHQRLFEWSNEVNPEFVDMLVQKINRLTIYDVYSCHMLMNWIADGDVVCKTFALENVPHADVEAERNSNVLNKCPGISAYVHSGIADSDGGVELLRPAMFKTFDGGRFRVDAGTHFCLEIGTTHAHTTWFHLLRSLGGLARWPYRRRRLYLLHPTRMLNEGVGL